MSDTIELKPTSLPHVFLCDIDDSGLLKEILLVKKAQDGTLYYVEIDPLHPIDKSRIKKIVSAPHADKYQCWELLDQSKLSNGLDALTFFHNNNVKIKRPRGSRASNLGLASVGTNVSDSYVGSDFSDPTSAVLDRING